MSKAHLTETNVYRPEIDGLRALAVIPVILFHAGIEAFQGGFIGVDVFFVISGYLITGIILRDLRANRFTLTHFYERRARRILPALLTVSVICIPAAWLWMMPEQLEAFAASLISVQAFASNFYFWKTSGYFASASETLPLLHTWSLAVEEQYYLAFPFLMLLLWRRNSRLVAAIVIGALLSFVLAQWGGNFSLRGASLIKPQPEWTAIPNWAFYFPIARAWELFAGALTAIYMADLDASRQVSKARTEAMAALGLGLILVPIFYFNAATPFPGASALVPVAGTLLIVRYGARSALIARSLRTPAMVGIGLISYSLYLWHQPLFAFTRIVNNEPLSAAQTVVLIALAVVPAFLTWKYVEQPIRRGVWMSRWQFVAAILALTVLCAGFGLVCLAQAGFPQRWTLPAEVAASFGGSEQYRKCFDVPDAHETNSAAICRLGAEAGRPEFMVNGDSHMLALLPAFEAAAKEKRIAGEFAGMSACPPFLGIHSLRADWQTYNCNRLNQWVFEHVKSQGIKKIFLVSRWTYYTDGGYDGSNFSFIGESQEERGDKARSREVFASGLVRTVAQYRSIGVKVFLIDQIPQQRVEPQMAYYRAYQADDPLAVLKKMEITREAHQQLMAYVHRNFALVEAQATIIRLDGLLCRDGRCAIGEPGESYYRDNSHLSGTGALHVAPALQPYL